MKALRARSSLHKYERGWGRQLARGVLLPDLVLFGERQRVRKSELSGDPEQRDRVAFGLLIVFAVLIYAIPGEWISGLQPMRLALVTASIAGGLVLLRRLFKLEPFYLDGLRGFALFAFAFLAQASVAWSLFPEASQMHSGELLKSLAIYLTMVNVVTTPRRLKILAAAIVLASAFPSIGAINWWRVGTDMVETYRTRWLGIFADPNYLAMNMAMIIPIAIAFAFHRGSSGVLRIACAVAGVLAVTTIVLTHSRGGFLGFLAGAAVWAMREKRRVQAAVIAASLVVGMSVLAPETFWRRSETIAGFRSDASAMSRVHAWEAAANMSKDRPLLGVGTGAFLYAWPIYRPVEEKMAHVAHNVFLDVVSELGFTGLILFLIFLGGSAGGAFQASRNPELAWLARGIAAGVVGFLTCSLFLSGYTLSAQLYMLCGLGACAERITRKQWAPIVQRERMQPQVVSPATVFVQGAGR